MKKRIVAIMLSLTMCLSMAAEASAASEAEFAAETAEADASDVAVIDDAEAENPSDNTADVDSEEAASDDVQIDMGADEDANAEAVDITDETESDFDAFSAEGEKTEISFEEQDVTACTEDTAVQTLNEVVKDNEASLSYTRWKSENGKWKLEKPPVSVNPAVQTAEASEADAVTDENAVEDEAFLVDEDTQDIQNEETADASEEDITEDTIDVQDMPETAEQKETAEDVQDGETAEQTTSDYFTDKDGIVKVTALKNNGDEICTAYYAFDENGDVIDFTTTNIYRFGYDGTEKTFKDIKFVPTTNTKKLVEGKDYEIKYFNNVTGPDAYVYINAIGNYTNATSQKFDGSEQTYATKSEVFHIDGVTVSRKDISISDTEYAGGVAVTPNVTIKVGEKTLVEGKDYKFENLYNNSDVTGTNKTLYATLVLKGAYKFDSRIIQWSGAFSEPYGANNERIDVEWKIVKKNLANTTVSVVKNGAELKATVLNGNVIVPESEYDVKDNGDGTATVTAKSTSKNYTGSQKVDVKPGTKVGTPVISGVKVVGNKATVILSGEADGASGYDYVISKANDTTTARVDVTKNQVKTTGDFNYVQQGTYYAYCHAWTRNAEGKKVFGEWSNIYPFSVSAITPAQPVITSVKAKGTTVTVTYTKAANAEGYDVVLGSAAKKVNGEYRPVEYGKLVKKNIKGNVVTATFKNVKKGTYYAGLHAFNRTSEDGKKVFSQWSNAKKVTVK